MRHQLCEKWSKWKKYKIGAVARSRCKSNRTTWIVLCAGNKSYFWDEVRLVLTPLSMAGGIQPGLRRQHQYAGLMPPPVLCRFLVVVFDCQEMVAEAQPVTFHTSSLGQHFRDFPPAQVRTGTSDMLVIVLENVLNVRRCGAQGGGFHRDILGRANAVDALHRQQIVLGILFDADETAVEIFASRTTRATAHGRIEHDISFLGISLDEKFDQIQRLLRVHEPIRFTQRLEFQHVRLRGVLDIANHRVFIRDPFELGTAIAQAFQAAFQLVRIRFVSLYLRRMIVGASAGKNSDFLDLLHGLGGRQLMARCLGLDPIICVPPLLQIAHDKLGSEGLSCKNDDGGAGLGDAIEFSPHLFPFERLVPRELRGPKRWVANDCVHGRIRDEFHHVQAGTKVQFDGEVH